MDLFRYRSFPFRRCRTERRRDPRSHRPRFEVLEQRNLLTSYFVDVAGLGGPPSDNNPGTITQPLATLQQALDRAGPGDTIYLRGGTYDVANGNGPISFAKSGLPGEPLTITAYPGEQPIIDLGQPIQWQMGSPGLWYGNLPEGTPVTLATNGIAVQRTDGWAATDIVGSAVDGGPPQDFTNPPAALYQGGQLAYDLYWYDASTRQIWLRSNQIEPITDPDTQCEVVSAASQFDLGSGSWVNINGLQFQDGYFGIHLESQGYCNITNCSVLHCSNQGILGASNYGEIADNYVDYVGGGLTDSQGSVTRSQLSHCIYFSGIGTSIHDNFFGRSLSGYSGQIIPGGGNSPMTIANNVFYGSYGDGLTLYSEENAIVTGNVCISHPVVWYGVEQSSTGTGMRSYYCDPDVTISGNFIEGALEGFVLYTEYGQQTIPGMVIVGNTSVGGISAGEIDGVPEVMNDNHWAGAPQMTLFDSATGFAGYLAWANPLGLETDSTWSSATLLVPADYDPLLDGNPSLASVLSEFRQYAADQINLIAGLPLGTATTIGGTSTPDAGGATPTATDQTFSVAAGATLTASVLAAGSGLTTDWFSGPQHGHLSLNSDGSFSYTPTPGFYGVDQFIYRVYDTSGGMAQATVTVNITGALTAVNQSYSLYSTCTLTVLAPGVLTNASLPGGETVSISTSQPQYGTLSMNSDGSFSYTPQAGFAGTDSFSYTITDQDGDTSAATVTLAVQAASAGVVTGPNGINLFRIWQSAGNIATINAMSACDGDVLTYGLARSSITQWTVSGGAGQNLLAVDYSNGDPLPAGGVLYDGGSYVATGSWLDGNGLVLLGVSSDEVVHAGAGQFVVAGSEPVNFTNVQVFGVDFTLYGNGGWIWWPGLTIMFGAGTLAVSDSGEYPGDLDSGAGTMQIDGPTTPHYIYVEVDSQLSGDGSVTFDPNGFNLGGPAGLYYTTLNTSAFAGDLSGPGVVEVDNGNLTLTGQNSYTLGTTVNSGSLTLGGPGSLPGYGDSGSVAVAAGATLTALAGGEGEWDQPSLAALLATTAFASGSTLGIEVDGTNSFDFGGDPAGAQAAKNLVKSGTGALVLTGANSLTGTTHIAAGTLQIGNGGTAGELGSGAVVDDGELLFDRTDSIAVSNAISGSGSLVQAGSGALTLPESENFSGGAIVSSGALFVTNSSGSATGPGDVSVQNAGMLGGSGTISNGASSLTVAGTLQPHVSTGGISQLTFTNSSADGLTLDEGASLNLDFSTSGSNDRIQVNGNLTLADGAAIGLVANQAGSWTAGSVYDFLDYSGSLIGGGTIVPPSPAAGLKFVVDTTSTPGHILLKVVPYTIVNYWTGATDGTTWDNGATANWSAATDGSGAPTVYQNEPAAYNLVEFNDNAAGSSHSAVTLDAAVSPSLVVFANDTASYVLSGPGAISGGTTSLIVDGGGSVTLGSEITYSYGGPTSVSNGSTLLLDGTLSDSPATVSSATLGGSGTLDSSLTFSGTSTVAAASNLTVSGATIVSDGTTTLGSQAELRCGMIVVSSGAALDGGGTLAGSALVDGTIQPHAGSASGATLTLAGGSLLLGSGAVLNFSFGSGAANDSIAVNSGSLLVESGQQTLALDLAGTFWPSVGSYTLVTASAGIFNMGTWTVTGLPTGTQYNVGVSGNSLVLNVTSVLPQPLFFNAVGGSWNNTADWSLASNAAAPNPAAVPGMNSIAQFNTTTANGNQTVTLDGAQTAQALQFVSAGSVTLNSGTGSNSLTLGTPGAADTGILVSAGAGNVTINAPVVLGTSQAWVNNSANLLTVAGNIKPSSGGSSALTLSGTGSQAITGPISNPSSGGVTSLIVAGGDVTLSGANSYSGGTVVEEGTLVIANAGALPRGSSLIIGNWSTTSGGSEAAASVSAVQTTADTAVAAEISSPAVVEPAAVLPAADCGAGAGACVFQAGGTPAPQRIDELSFAQPRTVDRVLATTDWPQVFALISDSVTERHRAASPSNAVLYDAQGRPVFRGG